MDLSAARVLVTGGGSGIGIETARMLVQAGAKVAVCGRRVAPLEQATADLGVTGIQGDVAVEDDAVRMVAETIASLGGYDVLINNAAVGSFAPLLGTSKADMDRVLAVNVTGAMLMARESARHFVENGGGTIINVGSTASLKGFAGGTAYAASKFALTGLTECWRAELRKHDVRVMQINPSEVQTHFARDPSVARPMNPSKLVSEDIAHGIVSMLAMHNRGFITDMTVWATNPQ